MPTVRFSSPVSGQVLTESSGFIEHQLELSAPTDQVVTVTIWTSPLGLNDIDVSDHIVTFQPGQTTATFRTAILDDNLYEADESFTFMIKSAVGAIIDTSPNETAAYKSFSATITDSDAPAGPLVGFASIYPNTTFSEGAGYIEREVVLSAPSDQVVTATITGPAYQSPDVDMTTRTVTFQPGQTSVIWRTAIVDDTLYEGTETMFFSVSSATNATVALRYGQPIYYAIGVNIADNDTPDMPTVRFAGTPEIHKVLESAGVIQHLVVLSAPSSKMITVTIEAPAYYAQDVRSQAQTLTFLPGQTQIMWGAAVYDDTLPEGWETPVFTIVSATNALVDQTLTADGYVSRLGVVIIDNDSPAQSTLGDDIMQAIPGATALHGDYGDDTLFGSSQDDLLRGDMGDDLIRGGDGFDDTHGNQGQDTVYGERGPDWVVGGQGNDLLSGDSGDDVVYGNLGADSCLGGDGRDWVRGGQGDDSLSGGDGDDFMSGDRGNDTLYGGQGADRFNTFGDAGIDRVMDFNSAQGDRVQFEGATPYALRFEGGDTVIDMGGGNQMILVGVTQASLGDWLV